MHAQPGDMAKDIVQGQMNKHPEMIGELMEKRKMGL